MGHHDLASSPRTPAFKRVFGMLGPSMGGPGAAGVGVAGIEAIADATLDASEAGLQRAKNDEGIAYSIYLLTQVIAAANSADFAKALSSRSIPVTTSGDPSATGQPTVSVFDLVAGFSAAIDRHLRESRSRSDISEIAQQSATESLSSFCSQQTNRLFDADLQTSLRGYAGQKGFGEIVQQFFARMSRRYIDYHLSRELSNHVGPERRFRSVAEHNQFLRELDDHCQLATKPVNKFAREWFSLHRFQDDLSLRKARGFTAHAIDKVRDALRYERGEVA